MLSYVKTWHQVFCMVISYRTLLYKDFAVQKFCSKFAVLGRTQGRHIITKVFSLLSLQRNLENFTTNGQTNSTHFLCSYAAHQTWCVPHTIQVWGIASFILVGHSRASL